LVPQIILFVAQIESADAKNIQNFAVCRQFGSQWSRTHPL
jgi:hypothetical protein